MEDSCLPFSSSITVTVPGAQTVAEDGSLAVPSGPGWGVRMDLDALHDHLVAAPRISTIGGATP